MTKVLAEASPLFGVLDYMDCRTPVVVELSEEATAIPRGTMVSVSSRNTRFHGLFLEE